MARRDTPITDALITDWRAHAEYVERNLAEAQRETHRLQRLFVCLGCGAGGTEVTWCPTGSGYENAHFEPNWLPERGPCGPLAALEFVDRCDGRMAWGVCSLPQDHPGAHVFGARVDTAAAIAALLSEDGRRCDGPCEQCDHGDDFL